MDGYTRRPVFGTTLCRCNINPSVSILEPRGGPLILEPSSKPPPRRDPALHTARQRSLATHTKIYVVSRGFICFQRFLERDGQKKPRHAARV